MLHLPARLVDERRPARSSSVERLGVDRRERVAGLLLQLADRPERELDPEEGARKVLHLPAAQAEDADQDREGRNELHAEGAWSERLGELRLGDRPTRAAHGIRPALEDDRADRRHFDVLAALGLAVSFAAERRAASTALTRPEPRVSASDREGAPEGFARRGRGEAPRK
jgi:hypothetical protein